MKKNVDLTEHYVTYYRNQLGGRLPVFKGQSGDGIGDFFRSILSHVLPFLVPALTSAAGTVLSEGARGMSEGKSIKEAYVGALRPALGSAVGAVGERLKQGGTARRRKHKRVYKKRKAPQKRTVKHAKRAKTDYITGNF
jgi:hypothetical protein